MLMLSRRLGEALQIELGEDTAPSTTIGELFRAGPIEITVTQIVGSRVKLGIQADRRLVVLRTELIGGPKAEKRAADESK